MNETEEPRPHPENGDQMAPFESLRRDLRDEQFRIAVLLGLVAIPGTVVVNWALRPDPVSATPVFVACVLSGYRYRSTAGAGTRAGAVTGIIGGIPIIVWQSATALVTWWGHPPLGAVVGDAWLLAAIAVGAAALTALVLGGVLWLLGLIGGLVGSWLHTCVERTRSLGSGAN